MNERTSWLGLSVVQSSVISLGKIVSFSGCLTRSLTKVGEEMAIKEAFLALLNGLKCAWVHEMERRVRNNFKHLDF